MRMWTHVKPVARRILHRTEMVEENKRSDHLVRVVWQHAPDPETTAKVTRARLYLPDNFVSHGTKAFPAPHPYSNMST